MRFTSRVHEFNPAFVLLASCFLSLQNYNPYFFLFLAGLGHIEGAGSSIFAASIGGYLERPACSIGDHLRSQNFCPRTNKIRTVLDTHQDIIEHDALVSLGSFLITMSMAHLKVMGKRTSPVTVSYTHLTLPTKRIV